MEQSYNVLSSGQHLLEQPLYFTTNKRRLRFTRLHPHFILHLRQIPPTSYFRMVMHIIIIHIHIHIRIHSLLFRFQQQARTINIIDYLLLLFFHSSGFSTVIPHQKHLFIVIDADFPFTGLDGTIVGRFNLLV